MYKQTANEGVAPKSLPFGVRRSTSAMARRLVIIALFGFHAMVSAEYLGNYGNLWAIEEEHGVEQITNKLKEMQRTGELDERMNRFRNETIDAIENPEPIAGIQTATFPRTYLLDPSVTVQENVVDDEGRIMVMAGTRINPLRYTKWTKSVLLIDARDKRQVDLALERLEAFPDDKVILVGGSYTNFMRTHKKRVYFDLGGVFTTRFNIKFVPSLVSQEGLNLMIREIAFEQESDQPVTVPLSEGVVPVKSDRSTNQ